MRAPRRRAGGVAVAGRWPRARRWRRCGDGSGLAARVATNSPRRGSRSSPRDLGGSSTALQRQIALTPDGATLLYTAVIDGANLTMRRDLDADESVPVPGVPPFLAGYAVSKDGQEFVGYLDAAAAFYRFPIAGGSGRALPRGVRQPGCAPGPATAPLVRRRTEDVDQGIGRLGPDDASPIRSTSAT